MAENRKQFALLIDGGNISITSVPHILKKLREYGDPRISKVFHNTAAIKQWEQIAREYDIEPIWVPNNIPQKNSEDIALVIEAMRLLYEHQEISGFCIVASDSDYTRLARHLKSKDKLVLGIGEQKTPKTFSNACTEFVFLEDLVNVPTSVPEVIAVDVVDTPKSTEEISDSDFGKWVVEAYGMLAKTVRNGDDGWVQLRDIREEIWRLNPELQGNDNFKYMRVLAEKMKALTEFVPGIIEIRESLDSNLTIHYVRIHETSEIERIRAAYRYAMKMRDRSDDGWITLSDIGSTLQKLYNTKYKGLKKIAQAYPKAIELDNDGLRDRIRMKA